MNYQIRASMMGMETTMTFYNLEDAERELESMRTAGVGIVEILSDGIEVEEDNN